MQFNNLPEKSTSSTTTTTQQQSLLSTHTVLRNTYFLLSLTLFFSALMTFVAVKINAQPNWLIAIIGIFGLMFLTMKLRNSIWGLVSIFAFTGVVGFCMGPLIGMILKSYTNGANIVMTALGGTGVIFFALSAYVLTTRKNFNAIVGFLFVGLLVAIVAVVANLFLKIAVLQLVISAVLVLIFSGFILYDTSRIINNGERNYIMATIALYLDIINLFQNLLILISAFSGNRN